jgi:hypothetical protein
MRTPLILAILVVLSVGHALAAPVAAVAGDVAIAAAADPTVSRYTALWRSGAFPSAIIFFAFCVLVDVRTRVRWLQRGYRAVFVAAAIGGLSILVEGIESDQTPNLQMAISAIVTAAALAMRAVFEPHDDFDDEYAIQIYPPGAPPEA